MGDMADLWDKFFGGKFSKDPETNRYILYAESLKLLLKEAHDLMDDLNASHQVMRAFPFCNFCNETGYDGQGLRHEPDCILVRIRDVISA